MIPKISARIRNFLYTFGSTSIAITARGAILLTANPVGCEQAWWLKRTDAERLLAECYVKGDVEAAAKRLQIPLTAHDLAVMRAGKALAQIDVILEQAPASGDLRRFNAAYKAKRLRAQARGERFMSYGTAQEKLKRSLVAAIADGAQGRPFNFTVAMARVFQE